MQKNERKMSQTGWQNMRRVLKYITGFWQLKVVLVLLIFNTILSMFSPAIIGSIIDIVKSAAAGEEIVPGPGMAGWVFAILIPVAGWVETTFNMVPEVAILGVFAFSMVVITILTGLFSYIQRYMSAYINQMATTKFRSDLYNSLLDQSFSFYDQQRTGQIMSRATSDLAQVSRFFSMSFNMIVSALLTLILVLYNIFSIDVNLSALALVVVPLSMFSARQYSGRVRPQWSKIRNQFGNITSALQENLMGVKVVKGFAMEDYEEDKFGKEIQEYFNINIETARIRGFFMPLGTFISALGTVLIIWYGGQQVINSVITMGSLWAFYRYSIQLGRPVRMIGNMTSMVERALTASDRVFEIIDAKIAVSDKPDAIEIPETNGNVLFNNVSFSYDGEHNVLKNINLTAEEGKTIAILGSTGSGKSTIINLIPRFYDVSEGNITLDGVDIRDIKINDLRKQIGIVRQDPFIFSTTLRENIAFGVEDATIDEIKTAAERAKIADYIESLPQGYDTPVGERGVTVSGGQKQRLAISRALLKNPKILILDDSTSSVDTGTEFEIQKALKELFDNRTTFIITQRLSSVKDADYIIVLESGEIIEEGSHEELMKKDGIYTKLYQTQITEAKGEEVN